jgi:hypothetical protein
MNKKPQLELFKHAVSENEFQSIYGASKEEMEKKLQKLEKQVFIYEMPAADIDFIYESLVSWMQSGGIYDDEYFESLKKFAFRMLWYLNDGGKTTKYLYFNERTQRLYVDVKFMAWIRLKAKLVEFNIDRYRKVR